MAVYWWTSSMRTKRGSMPETCATSDDEVDGEVGGEASRSSTGSLDGDPSR